MPYLRDISEGLELFRASEVVDDLPILKTGTMKRDEIQGLVTCKSIGKNEQTSHSSLNVAGAVNMRKKPGCPDAHAVNQACSSSSRPPTPPDAGSSIPVVRIGPCPVRLLPTIPPVNYGTVERDMIFRSAFPTDRNMDFVELLGIRSILVLVDTTPSEKYIRYVHEYGIQRAFVDIAPNKEGQDGTSLDSLCEALLFALDPTHHPLYIHCNQGRHRTGCVVACLRKIQQWPLDEILSEYDAYAHPKARPGDIDLIRSFDPQSVHAYAQSRGLLSAWSRLTLTPASHLTNVYSLPKALPRHKMAQLIDFGDDEDDDVEDHMFLPRSNPSFRRIRASQQLVMLQRTIGEDLEDDGCAILDDLEECDLESFGAHKNSERCASGRLDAPTRDVFQFPAISRLRIADPPSPRPLA